MSLRPYYQPREFPQLFVTIVYIQPKANVTKASEIIHNLSQKLESISPDAPTFILGDFKRVLRTYHQYVKCHTRKNNTLDLCYGTIPKAFSATSRPPLGTSGQPTAGSWRGRNPQLKLSRSGMTTVSLVSRGVLTVQCGRYLMTAALILMNSQMLFQTM